MSAYCLLGTATGNLHASCHQIVPTALRKVLLACLTAEKLRLGELESQAWGHSVRKNTELPPSSQSPCMLSPQDLNSWLSSLCPSQEPNTCVYVRFLCCVVPECSGIHAIMSLEVHGQKPHSNLRLEEKDEVAQGPQSPGVPFGVCAIKVHTGKPLRGPQLQTQAGL